jgi:hypothetical protein
MISIKSLDASIQIGVALGYQILYLLTEKALEEGTF